MAKLSRNRFLKNERGVTMLECALLVSLASVVIIAGVTLIGKETKDTLNKVGYTIDDAGAIYPKSKKPAL